MNLGFGLISQSFGEIFEVLYFILLALKINQIKSSNGVSRYFIHFSIFTVLTKIIFNFPSIIFILQIIKFIPLISIEYFFKKFPSKGSLFDDRNSSLAVIILIGIILSLPILKTNDYFDFFYSISVFVEGMTLFCQLLLVKKMQHTSYLDLKLILILIISKFFLFLYNTYMAFHIERIIMWIFWISGMMSILTTIDFAFIYYSSQNTTPLPI